MSLQNNLLLSNKTSFGDIIMIFMYFNHRELVLKGWVAKHMSRSPSEKGRRGYIVQSGSPTSFHSC